MFVFSLQSQYVDDCVMWDFMAKRELDAVGAPELQSAKGRASDTDRREERCCVVYEEALKSLNTGILIEHTDFRHSHGQKYRHPW